MTSRAGKFSAAFRITQDERAQIAEELMASIDRDADDDDDDELGFPPAREEIELVYAGDADESPASEDHYAPVSEDRWESAQLRLTRSS